MMSTPWTKATRSTGSGGDCVEVRRNGDAIEVRDSKAGDDGAVLRFTFSEFAAFLDGATNREFDHLLPTRPLP